LGLLASLALALSYLEALLPPITAAFPGIKMGLPNIVIVFVLFAFGAKEAALISVVRLLAVFLLFGNAVMLLYSATGACLSLALMVILKRTGVFSCVGVSVSGAVFHNLGQILVAVLMLETPQIAFYLPILTISGVIAGAVVGIVGSLLIVRLQSKIQKL
jgi:heptaprenyl diphosphate synthase